MLKFGNRQYIWNIFLINSYHKFCLNVRTKIKPKFRDYFSSFSMLKSNWMSVYLYVIKKDARAIPRQNVYVWVFLHVCDVITQKQLNWLGSNFFCYLTHLGQGWFWATKIWIRSIIFTVQKFGLIFSKRLLLESNFWNRSCFAFSYNKSFFQ